MPSAVFSLIMLGALLSARFDDAFAVDVTDLILLAVLEGGKVRLCSHSYFRIEPWTRLVPLALTINRWLDKTRAC
ncbi:hypothetical protein V8C44DRAFT_191397 [Trichoderma aethiopicum]